MAIERNPRNLRGFGNAIAPKSNMDYGFVDDQNRRQAQDKGIEAKEQQQQRNFKQRDKETRLDMLSKVSGASGTWNASLKEELNSEGDNIYKTADGMPLSQLQQVLGRHNRKVKTFNEVDAAFTKGAAGISGNTQYGSDIFRNTALGKNAEAMSGKTHEEQLAMGVNIASNEIANVPSNDAFEKVQEAVHNMAIQGSQGQLKTLGIGKYGKQQSRMVHGVDPNLNMGGTEQILSESPEFYRLKQQDNPDVDYREQIYNRFETEAWEKPILSDKQFAPKSTYGNGRGRGKEDNEFGKIEVGYKDVPNGNLTESVPSLGTAIDVSYPIETGAGGTNGKFLGFEQDEKGNAVARFSYKANNSNSASDAPTSTLQEKTISGAKLDEFRAAQTNKLDEKSLSRINEEFDAVMDSSKGDIDIMIESAMKQSNSLPMGSNKSAKEASSEITKFIESKGIKVSDINTDPDYYDDLSFSINGINHSFDFSDEDDRERLKKGIKNGFKKDAKEAKVESNKGTKTKFN